MNYSEPLRSYNGQIYWSDDGFLLASAAGVRLTIWDAENLEVLQVYAVTDQIDKIAFSPDSEFILASSFKTGETNIFSLNHPEWNGRVTEGAGGLSNVEWCPDSRHIVTTAEFHLKITIWSLSNRSAYYVKNPKSCLGSVIQYNRDKTLSAVVERQNCKDVINIFSTEDWSLVKQIECDTNDLSGFSWSPIHDLLVVWDSQLSYRVQVFGLEGRLLFDYTAYEHQLGVKRVLWSPSGHLLAVASCDNRIRIFDTTVWTLVQDIDHFPVLHEGDPVSSRCVIYQEENQPLTDIDARLALELGGYLLQQSQYRVVNERPVYLDFTKPDPRKPGAVKVGISCLEWSQCGRYIASKCENLPTAVWIWDLVSLHLASILVHKASVRNVRWDPTQPRLAIITCGSSLHFWTPIGCVIGRIPPVGRGEMSGVSDARWNPRGRSLVLANKEQAVLCRLVKKGGNLSEDVGDDSASSSQQPNADLDLEPSRESDNN